jgi:hypothetical protein
MPVDVAPPRPAGIRPQVMELPISSLRVDGGTQLRTAIDAAWVEHLVAVIRRGKPLPPLKAVLDGESLWLYDGFHRRLAYLDLKREEVAVEVTYGTLREAILLGVRANSDHGLNRDAETKRRAVLTLLHDEEWSKMSINALAEAAGVSWDLAKVVRDEHLQVPEDAPPEGATVVVHRGDQVYSAPATRKRVGKKDEENGEPAEASPSAREAEEKTFLESLPLYRVLMGDPLIVFTEDALHYHRVREPRKELESVHRRHASVRRPGGIDGQYLYYTGRFLRTKHPRDWATCDVCSATGKAGVSECSSCRGRGYVIP